MHRAALKRLAGSPGSLQRSVRTKSNLSHFRHSLIKSLTQPVSAERHPRYQSALKQTQVIKYLHVMHKQLCSVVIQPVPQRDPELDLVFIQLLPLMRGQIAVAFSLFPAIFAEKNTSYLLPGRCP